MCAELKPDENIDETSKQNRDIPQLLLLANFIKGHAHTVAVLQGQIVVEDERGTSKTEGDQYEHRDERETGRVVVSPRAKCHCCHIVLVTLSSIANLVCVHVCGVCCVCV